MSGEHRKDEEPLLQREDSMYPQGAEVQPDQQQNGEQPCPTSTPVTKVQEAPIGEKTQEASVQGANDGLVVESSKQTTEPQPYFMITERTAGEKGKGIWEDIKACVTAAFHGGSPPPGAHPYTPRTDFNGCVTKMSDLIHVVVAFDSQRLAMRVIVCTNDSHAKMPSPAFAIVPAKGVMFNIYSPPNNFFFVMPIVMATNRQAGKKVLRLGAVCAAPKSKTGTVGRFNTYDYFNSVEVEFDDDRAFEFFAINSNLWMSANGSYPERRL